MCISGRSTKGHRQAFMANRYAWTLATASLDPPGLLRSDFVHLPIGTMVHVSWKEDSYEWLGLVSTNDQLPLENYDLDDNFLGLLRSRYAIRRWGLEVQRSTPRLRAQRSEKTGVCVVS
jgi:hypothetical protein